MRDQSITTTMSHSDGFGSPAAIAAWGVIVASIGVPAPGLSQATASIVTRPRSDGS